MSIITSFLFLANWVDKWIQGDIIKRLDSFKYTLKAVSETSIWRYG